EWTGFAALGALSRVGCRAFAPSGSPGAGGPRPSAQHPEPSWAADMARDLPATVDHIVLQADLTALAPGPLEPDLAALMRTVARVESRGTATVFRIDHASIRSALDTGRSADELLAALADASRTPVPQPLDYLIRDIARVHGRTRIGGATAYVRSDDEATLRAMVSHRVLAPLRLRLLAPSLAVSSAEPLTVLELLREAGFAPVQETLDGAVVIQTPKSKRTPSRRRPAPMPVSGLDPAAAAALVRQLREAEGSALTLRAHGGNPRTGLPPTSDPLVVLAALRDATAEGRGVWIGYTDQNGTASPVFFYPSRIEAGRAWGAVPAAREDRGFLLHRITGVVAS
ncbi:MAG TPA: helicase-associated domain-containing protein, partial [Candidatus Lustribacter sp.]|nr:helicase-associated domain-containing protein [Candidatus Lustribacter sp.]